MECVVQILKLRYDVAVFWPSVGIPHFVPLFKRFMVEGRYAIKIYQLLTKAGFHSHLLFHFIRKADPGETTTVLW